MLEEVESSVGSKEVGSSVGSKEVVVLNETGSSSYVLSNGFCIRSELKLRHNTPDLRIHSIVE